MVETLELPQQAWLQGIMSHRIVTEERSKAMFKAATEACRVQHTAGGYVECIKKVNNALTVVNLEIRRMIDEQTEKHMLAIVNTKADEIAELATQFTPHEIEFIKSLIENIFTAPRRAYCISSTVAISLGKDMDPELSSTKADILCKKLVSQGWITKDAGFYFLSPRSLLELQSYLRGYYGEYMHTCHACKDIVTRGMACSTEDCDLYAHHYCKPRLHSMLLTKGDVRLCSKCKKPWSPLTVGDTTNASTLMRGRSNRNNGENPLGFTSVNRASTGESDDSEDSEEEDDLDETQGSGSKRARSSTVQSRSSQRRRITEEETVPLEEDEESE